MRELPSAALLHRQLDARSPDRAVLQARNGQLSDGGRGRQHQDLALHGVKDNPPYQRLLTLDDTVEFFNLVLGDKLTARLPTTLLLWVCERSRTSALGSRRAALRHQTSIPESPQAKALLETVRRIRSPPALRLQNLRKAWPSSGSSPSPTSHQHCIRRRIRHRALYLGLSAQAGELDWDDVCSVLWKLRDESRIDIQCLGQLCLLTRAPTEPARITDIYKLRYGLSKILVLSRFRLGRIPTQ
jgi:hypothetical protein